MRHWAALPLAAAVLCTGLTPAQAADAGWTILRKESTLDFTASYSGQEASGAFGTFGGTIVFDPDHLDAARIDITVQVADIRSPDQDIVDMLATDAWFAVAQFPTAHFVAGDVRADPKGGAKASYVAAGTLTLRGRSAPVDVHFHFDHYGPGAGAPPGTLRAVAVGEAKLSRTVFGVGQGEWASTVADGVRVTFTLTAERRASR